MARVDCFAWNEDTGCCKALTDTLYKRGECSFYKTREQYETEKVIVPSVIQPRFCDQPVIRVEDRRYYPTAKEAAAAVGGNAQYIVDACNGKINRSMGYHWRWAAKEDCK